MDSHNRRTGDQVAQETAAFKGGWYPMKTAVNPRFPRLRTFGQFAEAHTAFTEPSLRWLRFNCETNGFKRAFIKVGRRVLVDEETFFEVIRQQNEHLVSP